MVYIHQKYGYIKMLTKKQLKIFEPFIKNVYKEHTIKELKKISNEKSNNAISIALKRFKEEELVNERRIGKSLLYTLNIKNDLVFFYIALINNNKLPKIAQKIVKEIKGEVEKYTLFYSIAIFGSYAVNKQKKDSDLDIAIFIENEERKKTVQLALNSVKLKSILEVDAHVISQEEFLEMLKVDYANLGKEIARKHLLVYNHHIFYSLLNKGIKNGFKP